MRLSDSVKLVDAMKGEEARVLLASGLPKDQVLAQTKELSVPITTKPPGCNGMMPPGIPE